MVAGAKVLVVEDDAIVALGIASMLEDLGCTVLGPWASVAEALTALDDAAPDAALLDLKLADGRATPVASMLVSAGVPFAFITGYDDPDLDPTLAAAPRLAKPFGSAEIEDMLRQLLEGRAKPPLMQQLQAWRD
jgi:CheY-like chemotaxis protein